MVVAATWIVALLAGAACSSSGEPQPPKIDYGRDLCDHCGMVIDDPRFAAALLLDNGQAVKFDDLGEAFAYIAENPNVSVRARFVHDFQTQEWLRGEKAFFVVSEQVHSPMATGVAAFADRSQADSFARGVGAKVLAFDEVHMALKSMPMSMSNMPKMNK
jgi:copper chaperone NosL